MRYLMINTEINEKLYSGADRRRLELMKALCDNKNDNLIIIGMVPSELKKYKNVDLVPCDFGKRGSLSYNLSALLSIREIKKNILLKKYDIAVSWGAVSSIIMWTCGIRNIVTCNRENLYGYRKLVYRKGKDKIKLPVWWLIEEIGFIISRKIIVQCLYDKNALIKRHPLIGKRKKKCIDVQLNNVNASWMKPIEKKLETGESNRNEVIIAFVSSFEDGSAQAISRKGNDVFLPAAAKLIDEGFLIKVLVAGGGQNINRVKREYTGYPQIELKGFCNVADIFEMSDFAVCPSIMDSCPNALLEALAYGLPVYGSRVGGIIDILEDDSFMFEPTADSIYRKLKEIITERRYLTDADRQSKILHRLTFNWGEEMKKLIDGIE